MLIKAANQVLLAAGGHVSGQPDPLPQLPQGRQSLVDMGNSLSSVSWLLPVLFCLAVLGSLALISKNLPGKKKIAAVSTSVYNGALLTVNPEKHAQRMQARESALLLAQPRAFKYAQPQVVKAPVLAPVTPAMAVMPVTRGIDFTRTPDFAQKRDEWILANANSTPADYIAMLSEKYRLSLLHG